VAFSHRHNIIHRDLKPANILLAQDGGQFLPKIVDFGLARAGADSNVSLTGYGMGTMGYMPPEQRRDAKNVNHTADIYALGKILYELVSGAVPDNVLPNKIPPPPALARVIFKCIEDNPAERYFSVDDVLGELSNLSGPSAELVAGSNLDANACPSCQAPNRHDAKFCERCGAGMMRPCPECERENRVSLPFCGGCGTDVSAFLAVQDIAQKMRAYAGEKKWTRIEKEYGLLPESPRLPGEKGGKLLAEVKSLKETATAKLRRLVELQETITAAVQKRHYETAAKAVVECLEIDPDNAVAAQARRELDQLEAQAAAVVAELNAAMEGKHWRQARQQADAAAKDFPQFGYISGVRQKALAAAAEEKQRVAKFTEGLADATRLLQERRLVSCRRQVDDLLQLQGKLDVVDDPDCAKIMPAARERLAALAGDLQAAEAEAEELLAQAREKLSQGEDEACLLLCKSVQDRNAEDVECAGISAAAGEHFRAFKGAMEQLRMANLYWVAGRVSEAEKAIKTVLAFQPEHAEATQLWQEIRNQRRQRRRHLAKMVLMSIVVALAAYALFVGYRFQHTRQQVKVHLASATAAVAKQDWPAVAAAVDKALKLDQQNAQTKKFWEETVPYLPWRVPEGFRLAPGAGPEPYTNTGWAAAIIHEKSGIELVYIPAGTFTMGSPQGEEGRDGDEGPQHQVTLSQGFYLGKTEVTQAQWEKVTGQNPSDFQNAGPTAPVENVSWDDCQAFCEAAGSGLRLPMEAEWEYACRAGTTTAFHYGDSLHASMANFDGNYPYGEGKKGENRKSTIAVGQFNPNAWGLYDMHGNVWEWCHDWYGDYPAGAVRDPRGPDSGANRVLRGGCWNYYAGDCRSAFRFGLGPGFRYSNFGLRVACSAPPVQ
jgi:sulfatase modifying factor 1